MLYPQVLGIGGEYYTHSQQDELLKLSAKMKYFLAFAGLIWSFGSNFHALAPKLQLENMPVVLCQQVIVFAKG